MGFRTLVVTTIWRHTGIRFYREVQEDHIHWHLSMRVTTETEVEMIVHAETRMSLTEYVTARYRRFLVGECLRKMRRELHRQADHVRHSRVYVGKHYGP